jgi:hypothetical protein
MYIIVRNQDYIFFIALLLVYVQFLVVAAQPASQILEQLLKLEIFTPFNFSGDYYGCERDSLHHPGETPHQRGAR